MIEPVLASLSALSLAAFVVTTSPYALWPGFAEEIEVRGARPAREVTRALKTLAPSLAGCVAGTSERAVLFVDLELLAAGFVDRLTVLHRVDPNDVIDADCVRATLRALPLRDRGREPTTHVVLRLATTPGGVAPPAGTSPADVARALEVRRDELRRCIEEARRETPELAGHVVVRLTVKPDGEVTDVDAHDGTLASPWVRSCIAHEVGLARFPDGRSGGRTDDERLAWPAHFDSPPSPDRRRKSGAAAWDAPTFLDFLGCGAAF